ncbi:phthalate 4,5-dioxygenase [Limnohabitans sp. 2KL-1]|uniref:PDR/VanB family oxidoreductase n=1 Tax=Limnohabitans sp. 2KL-1 TaxID=1100699 RepID=UPI000D3AB017|nr:PDR/VanB family oxidoreductase [Limnohabitans sp. 2KL-1]PUE45051.1 phthalate 4,5-dioxygenase [Limnohabitans sp. 2KL-1]
MSESPAFMQLQIMSKRVIAKDTHGLALQRPDGADLPAFEAGAHLTVKVPSGITRQYSLCGDPDNRGTYEIAIKREANGRGGSVSLVDDTEVGQFIEVGAPVNAFGLDEKAKSFLLVAGGIGITPMRAMMWRLHNEGLRPFKLVYLTRDAQSTAFLDEMKSEPWAGNARVHHDHGDAGQAFDLWKLFEKPAPGCHVYCCGPKRLMDEVKDMTGHWASSAIHFESFGADTQARADDRAFTVALARTGKTVQVGAQQSLLHALKAEGVAVPSSCESGTCGSCKVRLLAGEADHRDLVLMDEEKRDHIMVCVSRACSDDMVLDL